MSTDMLAAIPCLAILLNSVIAAFYLSCDFLDFSNLRRQD